MTLVLATCRTSPTPRISCLRVLAVPGQALNYAPAGLSSACSGGDVWIEPGGEGASRGDQIRRNVQICKENAPAKAQTVLSNKTDCDLASKVW